MAQVFKRGKNDIIRLKCNQCGAEGKPTSATSRTVECKCGNVWDGIAEEKERIFYESQIGGMAL